MTEIETQDLVENVNKQLNKLGWIINPFTTTGRCLPLLRAHALGQEGIVDETLRFGASVPFLL
jgi:hypothetical protein